MKPNYNPVVRMFTQLRAALVYGADLRRHEVRPGAALDTLLPLRGRRDIWRRLRRQGLRVPALELAPAASGFGCGGVLLAAAALASWLAAWQAVELVIPMGLLFWWMSRPWAVHFPLRMRTVGELALCMTSYREHRGSGYRWSRHEITTKVRFILGECLNVPLEAVRPESTLAELGAWS